MLARCEICGKGKVVVTCHYCSKRLCSKCYGDFSNPRLCCKRETEDNSQRKAGIIPPANLSHSEVKDESV